MNGQGPCQALCLKGLEDALNRVIDLSNTFIIVHVFRDVSRCCRCNHRICFCILLSVIQAAEQNDSEAQVERS
jgi:hypothetical protein